MDYYSSYGYNISSTIKDYASDQISPMDNYFLVRTGQYEYVLVLDATVSGSSVTGDSYILYSVDPNNNYNWEMINNDVTVTGTNDIYAYSNIGGYADLLSASRSTYAVSLILAGLVCYSFFRHLMQAVMYRLHKGGKTEEVK